MKCVIISQRVEYFEKYEEQRDNLDHRLHTFCKEAGLTLFPVPNCLDPADTESWISRLEPFGVILSGGNDIGSCEPRDRTEKCMLNYAFEKELPVLGICRGMQMMAFWSGGKLKQVQNHTRVRHKLTGEFNSEVNSFHNQTLDGCPTDFVILAESEDGNIEAIRHKFLPWEGWMWHPEREKYQSGPELTRMRQLFS